MVVAARGGLAVVLFIRLRACILTRPTIVVICKSSSPSFPSPLSSVMIGIMSQFSSQSIASLTDVDHILLLLPGSGAIVLLYHTVGIAFRQGSRRSDGAGLAQPISRRVQ